MSTGKLVLMVLTGEGLGARVYRCSEALAMSLDVLGLHEDCEKFVNYPIDRLEDVGLLQGYVRELAERLHACGQTPTLPPLTRSAFEGATHVAWQLVNLLSYVNAALASQHPKSVN